MHVVFRVRPECPGGWDKGTIVDRSGQAEGRPAIVVKLDMYFEDWFGDDLVTTHPCFLVTERLRTAIDQAHLTGAEWDTVRIRTTSMFHKLRPGVTLPPFHRLIPTGYLRATPGGDAWTGHDFALDDKAYLIVSGRALQVLTSLSLKTAKVEPVEVVMKQQPS